MQQPLDELALFFDEVYDIDLFDINGTASSPFLDAASQLRPHAVQEDNLNGVAKGDISLTTLLDDLVAHYESVPSVERPGNALARTGDIPAGDTERTAYLREEAAPVANDLRVSIYPNPSVGVANVQFMLEKSTRVSVSVYDLRGHLVHAVEIEGREGINVHRWDRSTFGESRVGAGTYIVRLEVGDHVMTGKLVLL